MKKIYRQNQGKFWIKVSATLAVMMFGLVMFTNWGNGEESVAQAQGNNSATGEQLLCARDYSNFLVNGLDFDGEGFVDYWRDILVIYNTNYCQYSDIDNMLKRIDKARKQVRQAFYVCDKVTSAKVSADYYQMSAELYYLRHFVDTKESSNPKSSKAEKAQQVQPNAGVHALFVNMFVKKLKYFDAATAETVFTAIQEKYNAKIDEYKNCSDPNFTALKQKVTELIGTIETVKQMAKKFAEQVQQRWSAMEKRVAKSSGIWKALTSPSSLGDFFSKIADVRVNNEPIAETTVWEQIANTAKQNAPGELASQVVGSFVNTGQAAIDYWSRKKSSGSSSRPNTGAVAPPLPPVVTYDAIATDMAKIEKRDVQADLDLQYVSEYDLKYRQIGSAALDNMKANLVTLKKTVDDTFKPLDDVRACVSDIVGKQCSNKPINLPKK